jgi:hypothetical protein
MAGRLTQSELCRRRWWSPNNGSTVYACGLSYMYMCTRYVRPVYYYYYYYNTEKNSTRVGVLNWLRVEGVESYIVFLLVIHTNSKIIRQPSGCWSYLFLFYDQFHSWFLLAINRQLCSHLRPLLIINKYITQKYCCERY